MLVNGGGMFSSSLMNSGPANTKKNRTKAWKMDCPPMCLTILLEMMYSLFLYGGLCKSSSTGSSVAKAREARESMIMLTQRSCTGLSGGSFKTEEAMNETIRATTLTVSWNYKNLLMLS